MSGVTYSFIEIFNPPTEERLDVPEINKIVIPIIQRDYAQGRTDPVVNRIRARFLDALYRAITERPIILDFVYGDVEKGKMTPLDGQQRLTTLFLLHWYAAKKGGVPENEWKCLNNFSYETRYSARDFCQELVAFSPVFSYGTLSEEIKDQAWFPLDWEKDPTIASILVMLDAIDEKFKNVENLWETLKNGAIKFHFLAIKEMGLTDELYIRMNSRGKPLTLFEHFKAELEKMIEERDKEKANLIARKIDIEWTDLLWKYRNSGTGMQDDFTIDDEFLRYFRFVCDVICFQSGGSLQETSTDVFDLLKVFFSSSNVNASKNTETLESLFDCWRNIPGFGSPSAFFNSFMAREHVAGKILVDSTDRIDLFEDCLRSYSDRSGRNRMFTLGRTVLLFAITVYLRHASEVTFDQFTRRIRIINNLIRNSTDEIVDRTDRNRMPGVIRQAEMIMLTGEIDTGNDLGFNRNQLEEERYKDERLQDEPEKAEELFALEDHDLLFGQIGILGWENLRLADRFEALFKCDWDKVDCALMTIGKYGQKEKNGWRYQFGSKNRMIKSAWIALFHKSSNSGFDITKDVLVKLLSASSDVSDSALQAKIDSFIANCESNSIYPWEYYYIKYSVFRPGAYGKMSNSKETTAPYLFSVMQTKTAWSENMYLPYLKVVSEIMPEKVRISREQYGQRLVFNGGYIVCLNNAYKRINDDGSGELVSIRQNDESVDVEDRITRLKDYIEKSI